MSNKHRQRKRLPSWFKKIYQLTSEEAQSMGRKSAKMSEDNPQLLIKTSVGFMDEARRLLSLNKVKRMFGLGTELFGAAAPFLDNPTWWNATKSLFAMGKCLVEDVEVWSEDYFSSDNWVEPYNADFNQTLVKVFQQFPFERIKTSDENVYIRMCILPNGCKVGWTYTTRMNIVDHIYVEAHRLDEARQQIKQLLWEQFSGKSLVMRRNVRSTLGDDARVVFEVDDAFESKLSRRARELSNMLCNPLQEGISRSIMFYGPPGTGKSTLARTIVELMNLRSFRIRIGDLGGIENSTLFEAINIFEPDAIILDDFDRSTIQATLLETLEFFQQRVKLVITTVNNLKKLDKALLRPGRVDMIERVEKMDGDIVKHILGEYEDAYDIVKNWPIAYINEYVKRRKFMSTEEAADSIKELSKRVRAAELYDDSTHNDLRSMLLAIKNDPGFDDEIDDDIVEGAGEEVCADSDEW